MRYGERVPPRLKTQDSTHSSLLITLEHFESSAKSAIQFCVTGGGDHSQKLKTAEDREYSGLDAESNSSRSWLVSRSACSGVMIAMFIMRSGASVIISSFPFISAVHI